MGQVADLVTRLLLDGSNFDDNITKSTKQIKNMQRQAEQAEKAFKDKFSAIVGVVGKLAASAGLAVGAFEIFNSAINSSASVQREFKIVCDTAKQGVDDFFRSLYTGDDTSFFKRMENIRKSVESTIDFMRNAAVRQILMERYNAAIIALKEQADVEKDEDKKKEYETRARKLSQQALELNTRGQAEYDVFIKNTLNALSDGSAKFFKGAEGFTKLLTIADTTSKERKRIEDFKEDKERITGQNRQMSKVSGLYGMGNTSFVDTKKVESELKEKYGKEYEYLSRASILVEGLNEDMITTLQAANDMAGKLEKDATGTLGDWKTIFERLGKDNFRGSSSTEILPEGSIAHYKEQLGKLSKEFELATSDQARVALQAKIDELKEIVNTLSFYANNPNPPSVGDGKTSLKQKVDPGKGLQVKGLVTYTQEDIETNNEFADSLNAIAQIMGNIQNATSGAAGEWISFAGNLMTSTAGMVTAVNQLSKAYEIQALNAKLAAQGEAIKSAAMTPFVGWLLVGAAAASVAAAFASVPKYASGGIVGGASPIGDLNIARVNSGEMILNGTQQSRLFSLLDGGSPASNGGGGKVEFKIRGQELIGVLDNHNRKTNKLR
ncbi:hypothetical protein [uncultured Bacteroides sp.]|uniref:hypothetical protein n=1 Tax=uncultured Bacteroides sp. TaxID=162156 RepID=UPI00261649BF|nr:hypothetical protein [uncultured Bacteroides sp.]